MSILKCMVEWSRDMYVNPNLQANLGKCVSACLRVCVFVNNTYNEPEDRLNQQSCVFFMYVYRSGAPS